MEASPTTKQSTDPYIFRPYTLDDLNFIRNSWAISFQKGCKYKAWLTPETFNYYHRPMRDRVLSEPTLAIIVCAGKDCPEVILGWIAVETVYKANGFILHYIYVKGDFTGSGIGSELLKLAVPTGPVFYTHRTNEGMNFIKSKDFNFLYAPHLI